MSGAFDSTDESDNSSDQSGEDRPFTDQDWQDMADMEQQEEDPAGYEVWHDALEATNEANPDEEA